MNHYALVRRAVRSQVWAMQPEKVEAMMAFLALKAQGIEAGAEVIEQMHANAEVMAARAQKVAASNKGAVAVLPLYGAILGRPVETISSPGGASVQKFTAQFRQVLNDPNVQAIVIDIDSPGGSVEGVPELADEIRAAKGQKPVIAVSNWLCCSAAYWIASACSEIYVSPSSLTGSVGVYSAHEDDSRMLDEMGIKVTLIQYGANKTAGNPYEPLSDAARADTQQLVDTIGAMFDSAVAKGRRTSQANVRDTFGQGKVFDAKTAVKIGMADKIGTLDDVLARFGVTRSGSAGSATAAASTRLQAGAVAGPAVVGCTCGCQPCLDGDCSGCDVDGCDAAGCRCGSASATACAVAHSHRERELALL